jgi:hypothetical protein
MEKAKFGSLTPSKPRTAHEAAACTSCDQMTPATRKSRSGWKLLSDANGRSSPFRPGDEIDQAEVDRFMRILPGLATSTSRNQESRERGLQSIKESLFKLDGMALDMGRRIAFIKAYGGLLGYESQSPEEGWDKVLDILDAEHKRLQAEWDASCKRFYEKEEQKRIERAKKAKRVPKTTQGRKARGQKASPTVSSSRSKGA